MYDIYIINKCDCLNDINFDKAIFKSLDPSSGNIGNKLNSNNE